MNLKKILSGALSIALCLGAALIGGSVSADAADVSLRSDSKLMISDDAYLYRIRPGTTAASLAEEFEGDITVKNGDTVVASADPVKSGFTVTAGDTTLTCAVTGDVNGDGKITLTDVAAVMRYLARWNPEIHIPAIDANLDGRDNLADASLLMKHIAAWDVYVGTFDVVYSEDRVTAPNEDSTLSLSVTDNMQKIDQRDPEIGDSATYRMRLAKNEIESCQIYLASAGGHAGMNVTYTDFANGVGGVIETEMTMHYYFKVNDPSYSWVEHILPDANVPLSEFDVEDTCSQGFLLKLKAERDAEPGLYMSKVTVRDSTGKAVKIAYVYAEVWDITLPDEPSCATAFGLERHSVYSIHEQYESDDSQLYINYYEYLLENRISAYHLPYEFSDPRFEDYMNDPRVTSFCVDGCQTPFELLTDSEIEELYEKYGDNETWNKKAYFYYVDEPGDMEKCDAIIAASERLERLFPGARHIAPTGGNPWYGDKDQYALLRDYLNLWCPVSHHYTPVDRWDPSIPSYNFRIDEASVEKYGTAEERFAALKESGEELWWYVCVGPEYPYPNIAYLAYEGERARVLFWQQYMYDIDGLLFWAVNDWFGGDSLVWRDHPYWNYTGDGVLLYSGKRYGIYGPLGSLRLEYTRDGIEDFEYLTMAERLCGSDAVAEVLSTVTTGVLDFTTEAEVIEAAKCALAELILTAGK